MPFPLLLHRLLGRAWILAVLCSAICILLSHTSFAANSETISTPGVTCLTASQVLLLVTTDNAVNTAPPSRTGNDSQDDNSHLQSFLVVFVLFLTGYYIFLKSIGAGTKFYIGPDGRSHGNFLITGTMFGGGGGGFGGGGFAGGGGGFGGGGASGGW